MLLLRFTLALSILTLFESSGNAADSPSNKLDAVLGVSFPSDHAATAVLERDGKRYLIDTANKTVTELTTTTISTGLDAQAGATQSGLIDAASLFRQHCAACHGSDGKGRRESGTPNFTDPNLRRVVSAAQIASAIHNGKDGRMPAWSGKLSEEQISALVSYVTSLGQTENQTNSAPATATSRAQTATVENKASENIYTPGDDVLISVPTGRPTDRHGIYVNFSHRFAYDTTFTGTARGQELFGLDGVALPSFGVRYGITDRLSVSAYRSPSLINRPIQLMAGYNLLEEQKGDPLNLMVRFSVEGQDNFKKNYTENIEAILSRSITKKAQIYLVPTVSFNNRPLLQPAGFNSNQILNVPGVNTFALGIGMSVDIRPTVALLAEVTPTLVNGTDLGIHRPSFSFGIQKKIWRHAFTLGFTNSPGTTVSQRAGTRATFLGDPSADTFGGLTLGFNITRQIR
jgi:mono/diheme cytochrome c family protein